MKLIKVERFGIIFITLFVFLLSNLYFLTEFDFFKFICAGNNSMLEQMKVVYFSYMFFMIIEMICKIQYNDNFFLAKAISTYILVFSIPMFFYTFKNMFGVMNTIFYFILVLICVGISQSFSYKILLDEQNVKVKVKLISIMSIILLGIILVYFSYNPLNTPIFMDI